MIANKVILLSLGSNYNKEQNMDQAVDILRRTFNNIIFSKRVETQPYGRLVHSTPFLNQVAIAYTHLDMKDLNFFLKNMEREIGRIKQDEYRGLIAIDIDLIQWNDTILKPEDLQRDYIQTALQTIEIEEKAKNILFKQQ